jgi:protein-arginine deiminase
MANARIGIWGDFLHNGTTVESRTQTHRKQRFLIAPRCTTLDDLKEATHCLTFRVELPEVPPNGTIQLEAMNAAHETDWQYREGEQWKPLLVAGMQREFAAKNFPQGISLRFTALHRSVPANDKETVARLRLSLQKFGGRPLAQEKLCIVPAPFLMQSSLDPVSSVLVVKNKLTAEFAAELEKIAGQAAVPVHPIEFATEHPWDVWMQDCIEIGAYVLPNRTMDLEAGLSHAFLPGIRSLHDGIKTETLDAQAVKFLGGLGMKPAVNLTPRPHTRWIDWYGNLEVSPPVTSKAGKRFPLGRVLYGKQKELTMHPDVLKFLECQGVQTPAVEVNTSWLTIGHVDEVVNFVPARDRKRFRALLPSPQLATHLLEQAAMHGAKNTPVFQGKKEQTTVENLLETVARSDENRAIEAAIRATQAQLETELGLAGADFIFLPVLFKDGLAVIPNGVNGLMVNGHYIVPAPCGPEIAGRDIWAEAIRTPLERLGVKVHFVDIWEPYHTRAGEIHCGTNAIRRPARADWWRYLSV